ncbi:hypothetical protein RSSM_01796 [Rhodopirellula sallentina SM41]|uniref:Uncharacterized protein n=1 Tax=Rhodopirellula sallentina SM41 TaxID=1263870 RepID=M5UFZ6_9BACT|nr:hypothetical protein RSSM_01796 [Rhodopirellula sallentina SM41]
MAVVSFFVFLQVVRRHPVMSSVRRLTEAFLCAAFDSIHYALY